MYQMDSQIQNDADKDGAALFQMKLDHSDSDDEQQILKQLVPKPINDSFTSAISEIPKNQSTQPSKSVSELVDSFLMDLSNNEKIVKNFTNADEEDYEFEDTLEDFEFREYQLELYEKGIGKNSIIYLETGLGKTLVIIMLMWERMKQFPNKKVVFLANTIQLVEQQAAQIAKKLPRVVELLDEEYEIVEKAKNLGKDIKVIHGSKCTDVWNSLMWQIMLEENTIFVMTTQIFLNILRKGYKKIEDFSFIAMDECHSAVQDHPYNYILKEFYMPTKQQHNQLQIKDSLPQIIGATASPVMNSRSVTDEQILKDLLQLAANMDSTYLYTDADSIRLHLNEAKVIPVQYQMLFNDPDIQKIIDHRSGYEQCVKNESRVFEILRKNNYLPEFFQIQQMLEEFRRKYTGNLTLKIIIAQISKQLLVNGFTMYLELGPYVFILLLQFVIEKLKDFSSIRKQNFEEQQIQELLKYLNTLFVQVQKKYGNISSSCTPKVQQLIKLLRTAYNTDLENMILIFVKQRITACFLSKIISSIITPEYPTIQSEFIIGHCSSLARKGQQQILINVIDSEENDQDELIKALYNELQRDQSKFSLQELKDQVNKLNIFKYSINFAQQKQILTNFRSGLVKILISTSVAEEGIDIPMCNYVIGFNPITSSKAYVQMKGRARKENSKFIIFMADRVVQSAKVTSHQKVQQNTKKIIEELTLPQRQPMLQKALAKIQQQQIENQFYDFFIIEESGANINTNWSCTLIYQFCQSVILEGGTKAQPKYAIYQLQNEKKKTNGDFLAFLLLPFQLRSFIFYGQKAETVQNAKASAALSAAKQLYQNGYLDVNLKPSINSDFGQHIGADQDDSQIMMSKEQFQISQQYSAKVITQTPIEGLKINSQQRYYQSIHKSLFSSEEKATEYYQWTCCFKEAQLILIFTKCQLQLLYNSQSQLQLCGFKFNVLTNISSLIYSSCFDDYREAIIQEENLSQVDEQTYSFVGQDNQVRFEPKVNNYLFALKTNKCKICLREIIFTLELGLKTNLFKEQIVNNLSKNNEKNLLEIEMQPNRILDQIKDYSKMLTCLRYGIQGIPQQRINYEIIYKQEEQQRMPLENNLDFILMNSLNLQQHEPNELLLGDCYYKFLIALELFTNSFLNDPKITSSKIKTFTRSTFVRNCLFESHTFLYLHKFEKGDDITKIYIGLKQKDLYDAYLESIAISKTNKWQNTSIRYRYKIHLSNQEFLQFMQKSLSIIEKNDENQVNGIRWIECFKLTQQVKHPITQATDLLKYMPVNVVNNMDQLKLIYNKFEEKIKYSFKNFSLLFQAMTDVTFKHILNNQISQKYYQPFQMKNELIGLINELQLQQFQTQFDQMNKIDCQNLENSGLAVLGRQLWSYITVKHLIFLQLDPFAVRIIGKILTGTPFLAYVCIKLKFHEYLNAGVSAQLLELAKQIEMIQDQSVAFHISTQVVSFQTLTLENAFYALIAAIYFDSKCNIKLVQQWQRCIFEKLNIGQLFTKNFIESQPRYKFYVWYEKNFGNPFDFNLIKIPHTNYQKLASGEFLFVPYNMKNAQIVNIKKEKFYDISQLHIYTSTKRKAWDKLYEIIEY